MNKTSKQATAQSVSHNHPISIGAGFLIAGAFVFALLWAGTPTYAAGTYDPPKVTEDKTVHKSYRKAQSHIAASDYQSALSALTLVLNDEPSNADAWNLKGFSHRKLGDYTASQNAYETALRIEPTHSRAMEYMGELYLTLNNLEGAEALLARLNKACSYNCTDRDMLKKAIAAYKKRNN